MVKVQTSREVRVEDVVRTLADSLGSKYQVDASSDSTITVGRRGVIPSKVTLVRRGDKTTFKVATTGLLVSRGIQAASINPKVRRALDEAYGPTSA
jgi:hypothetical protein